MLTLQFGNATVKLSRCEGVPRGVPPIREFCNITYCPTEGVCSAPYTFWCVPFEWSFLKQRFVLSSGYGEFQDEVTKRFPSILIRQNVPLMDALHGTSAFNDGSSDKESFWGLVVPEIALLLTEEFRPPGSWLERKYREWVWRLYEYLFGRFACYGEEMV